MKIRILLILLIYFNSGTVYSQSLNSFNKTRDSLFLLPDDSAKVVSLISFCQDNGNSNFLPTMEVSKVAIDLVNKLKWHKMKAKYYNVIGDLLFNRANYQESFRYYYAGYKLADSIGNKYYTAMAAYNLGWQAAIQQKNYKDVSYIYQALKIGEEIESNGIILRAKNALGSFYTDKYDREHKTSDFDSAVKYFSSAVETTKIIKAWKSVGALYSNMGQLFFNSKDYSSSIFYYKKAIELYKGDSINIVGNLLKIGAVKSEMDNTKEAMSIIDFVSKYATYHNLQELKKECLIVSIQYFRKRNDYQNTYLALNQHAIVNEQLNKELKAFTISNLETEYDYLKSQASNAQLKQAGEIQELKNRRKSIYISVLAVLGLVIIIMAFLLIKQSKLKQKTNLKLKSQNKTISEKKEEIEQSIEYAKGIQTSFLPEKKYLNEVLPNNFIFYRPKDVVSGDFYWFEFSKDQKQLLIACADSTGHGVPGSLLSMVGINMLQQLCGIDKLNQPGIILKNLNNKIINALKQNSENVKQRDGMDIALIHLDLETNTLLYSGANRPLYLVKNGQLFETKATKHAIGGYTNYNQTFEEHKFELNNGDAIYLSTDGYADQFGGEYSKKMMTKKLKEVLSQIADKSTQEQRKQVETVFDTWKGEHTQVDDICLIGLKV